jgi:hypothetical protein
MNADFARHWSEMLMPEMRRKALLAAIRIVTADDPEKNWATFNAAVAELEREAHRLGASVMPDEFQGELHRELVRELVDSIAAVMQPWHDAELTAGIVAVDLAHWDARVREWALLAAPSGQPG